MNAQQAENLRVLIRHAESNMSRILDMNHIESCGTPACMLGEAICVVKMPAMLEAHEHFKNGRSIWGDVEEIFSSKAHARLFGMAYENAWMRAHVTPQEWAVEARTMLAENGYSMDAKPDAFPAFMARVMEPVAVTA